MERLIILMLGNKNVALCVGWMFFGTLMSIACGITYGLAGGLGIFSGFGIVIIFLGYLASGTPGVEGDMPDKEVS